MLIILTDNPLSDTPKVDFVCASEERGVDNFITQLSNPPSLTIILDADGFSFGIAYIKCRISVVFNAARIPFQIGKFNAQPAQIVVVIYLIIAAAAVVDEVVLLRYHDDRRRIMLSVAESVSLPEFIGIGSTAQRLC